MWSPASDTNVSATSEATIDLLAEPIFALVALPDRLNLGLWAIGSDAWTLRGWWLADAAGC